MKVCKILAPILAVAAICFSNGCRNHLKDIDTTMTDYERNTIRDVSCIQLLERDENNGALRFKVTGNREAEVKVYEVHNTIARFTPYQFWRELYEVPVGIFFVPVSIFSHVLNVVTLGIFPYSWCWEMDCYGLASLNPFMNTESDTRYEDEPVRSLRDLVDTRMEIGDYILHQSDVMFKIGNKTRHKLTDDAGIVTFDLLDLKSMGLALDDREREFKVYVKSSPLPSYTWIIPRSVKKRFRRARDLVRAYEQKQTPENLYRTVMQLEELKLSNMSYLLEQREVKRHGKRFAKEFYALDSKY